LTLCRVKVVESGDKNIEIAVMTHKDGLRELEEAEIEEYVAEIEAEDSSIATCVWESFNSKNSSRAVDPRSSTGSHI
jgi:hypothetical protein